MEMMLQLRHRELINYLQSFTGYVTGAELAKYLEVSERTVRQDIFKINGELKNKGIQILSKPRFGYLIHTEKPDSLKMFTQSNESFISRNERIRHIARRLALSDESVSLNDLSYEMYISKTTLEHDLQEFRRQYVLSEPYIQLCRKHNSIYLEKNERKRRLILCTLYSWNWNFNGNGNIYYHYNLLDEKVINLCMMETQKHMEEYGIKIEDNNLVHMNLMIAVAYERIIRGKELTDVKKVVYINQKASECTDSFFDSLEQKLRCTFNLNERREIAEFLSCSIVPDMDAIRKTGVQNWFSNELLCFCNEYLTYLHQAYGIDFFNDQEFLLILATYLDSLRKPLHYLHHTKTAMRDFEQQYLIEFELANAIQPFALKFYGNYLNFEELMYLSFALSGGLSQMRRKKMKAVIMCHYNEPAAWNLGRKIEETFPENIRVERCLSVYQKDSFDFSNIDLIISTADKRINFKTDQIKLTPFGSEKDMDVIRKYLKNFHFKSLYRRSFPSVPDILQDASWNENLEFDSFFDLLEMMGKKFITKGYAEESFLTAVFRRERVLSFASHPSYIIVNSSVPVRKTHIEITTLKHRINVNNYKIRMVIMLGAAVGDQGLIFKLFHDLYLSGINPEETRFLTTKTEYLDFFQSHSDSC